MTAAPRDHGRIPAPARSWTCGLPGRYVVLGECRVDAGGCDLPGCRHWYRCECNGAIARPLDQRAPTVDEFLAKFREYERMLDVVR